MAAIDSALAEALRHVAPEQAQALKRAAGDVMGQIAERMLFPATRAFPELDPDQAKWRAIALARAGQRIEKYREAGGQD